MKGICMYMCILGILPDFETGNGQMLKWTSNNDLDLGCPSDWHVCLKLACSNYNFRINYLRDIEICSDESYWCVKVPVGTFDQIKKRKRSKTGKSTRRLGAFRSELRKPEMAEFCHICQNSVIFLKMSLYGLELLNGRSQKLGYRLK